jgi:hypothetical protein
VNLVIRGAIATFAASLLGLGLGAADCGGPPGGHATPGAGPKFACGWQVEGAGGHAKGTFDISDDGRGAYKLDFSPPVHKGSSYRCDAGSNMTLDVRINDGQVHRLQCKLRRKGEQVDEDHAGTFVSMKANSPHVHCRYDAA